MDFALCGGDLRSVYLAHRLQADGHGVRCYGLDTPQIPNDIRCRTIEEACAAADCIVLPTPAFPNGMLHTPFAAQSISAEEVIEALPVGIPVFGGSLQAAQTEQLALRGITPIDLLTIASLAVTNAAITAECALQVILERLPRTLADCPVLIIGAGRIGKLLGLKLRGLGARVTVSARREEDKAWCAALGLTPADTARLTPLLPHCRVVANTVPAAVVTDRQLQLLPHDALLLELASVPGGFPQGHPKVLPCGGLPGKLAPQSAANAIAETIYAQLTR